MSKKSESAGGEDSATLIKNLSEPGGSGFVRQSSQQVSDLSKSKQNLTIGKVQKRTFAPTIPTSRRIRKERSDEEKPAKRESKPPAKDRKGKRRERKDLIKSESVFSMGPAGRSTPGRVGTSSAGGGGGDRGAAFRTDHEMVKTVLESTATSVPLPKLEEDDDSLVNVNLQHLFVDSQLPPFRLPLDCGMRSRPNSSLKRNDVEDQPTDEEDTPVNASEPDVLSSAKEALSLTELLTAADHNNAHLWKIQHMRSQLIYQALFHFREPGYKLAWSLRLYFRAIGFNNHISSENYLFMQLPDRLPMCLEPSLPDDDKSGDRAQAEVNTFSNVPEGRIGKLIVRKSGKVSLTLGAVSLDVSMGTPCGFLQELVCIQSTPPDCRMTSVGHLSHRLVCTPDFENIL